MVNITDLETILRGLEFDGDRSVFLLGAVGVTSLVFTFVAFLLQSSLVIVPFVLFVSTVAYGWHVYQATTVWGLTLLMTVCTILILGLITVYLVVESIDAFGHMGLEIFTRTKAPIWSSNTDMYGLAIAIHGTLVTTLLATIVAGPFGIAGALFISEIAPNAVGEVVKPGIELLAGIPSIVYGFIGYTILNRYLSEQLSLPTFGSYLLVGMVVGFMALPTVVSVAEDAITSVPESMKNGSLALGSTDWQTMTGITLPAAFSGISAAVLLGIGRAVGETMAATVILGNTTRSLPDPLYDVFGNNVTLTSLIASQGGNASGMQLSALFAAGVTLFVVVMVISVASQLIERRMKRTLRGAET